MDRLCLPAYFYGICGCPCGCGCTVGPSMKPIKHAMCQPCADGFCELKDGDEQ